MEHAGSESRPADVLIPLSLSSSSLTNLALRMGGEEVHPWPELGSKQTTDRRSEPSSALFPLSPPSTATRQGHTTETSK
eukprot:391263-Hanusia_phi.AAC.1